MLGDRARTFIERYEGRQEGRKRLADLARLVVQRALDPFNLDIHLVDARPKARHSALAKIRRKGYGAPERQLTDQVGVRVITYFQEDVDLAAVALRKTFEIDEGRSVDKRQQLGVQQFGYRSVHLVARFGDKVTSPECRPFAKRWFEIQIRSILEHAWAEIEHELNYKSGIAFSDGFLRRFGALAGTLEILEAQFLALREERDRLIETHRIVYGAGKDANKELDAARLLGLLEARRPDGLSWRRAEAQQKPFAPRIEAVCLEAMRGARIRTAKHLDRILKDRRFKRLVTRFAASSGIAPAEVSHLAIVVIAIAMVAKRLLLENYPELVEDRAISQLL